VNKNSGRSKEPSLLFLSESIKLRRFPGPRHFNVSARFSAMSSSISTETKLHTTATIVLAMLAPLKLVMGEIPQKFL